VGGDEGEGEPKGSPFVHPHPPPSKGEGINWGISNILGFGFLKKVPSVSVIPVKTGIQDQKKEIWISAGVYPDENRGRNDEVFY
jgi:hypothetical protein